MSLLEFIADNKATLLIGGGIGTMITGGIFACRATFKLSPILEDHMDVINNIADLEETNKEYKEGGHDRKVCYFKTIKKITKLYFIPFTITVMGTVMVLSGTKMITDDNAKLSAAVTTTMSAFNEYRGRVSEKYGKEQDEAFLAGDKEIEVEETDAKGKKKKVKKTVSDPDAKGRGYLRYITRSNPLWNEDSTVMRATINREQQYLTNLLRASHRLTIDKVYERLCILSDDLDSADDMIMGWLYDEGADFVDLNARPTTIVNSTGGTEPAWIIDPNVQCNVHKTLRQRKIKALKEVAA